jgi:hypothetical protein
MRALSALPVEAGAIGAIGAIKVIGTGAQEGKTAFDVAKEGGKQPVF